MMATAGPHTSTVSIVTRCDSRPIATTGSANRRLTHPTIQSSRMEYFYDDDDSCRSGWTTIADQCIVPEPGERVDCNRKKSSWSSHPITSRPIPDRVRDAIIDASSFG